MAGALVGGALLGAAVSEGLTRLIKMVETVLAFEPVSKELASTVKDLEPIIKGIVLLQRDEDLKSLKVTIDKAEELVKKCAGVHRMNGYKKAKYTKKIWEIQREMVSFCQFQLQLLQYRNQLQATEDIEKLDNMMKYIDDNLENVTKQLDLLMKTVINNHQIVIGKFDSASKERHDYHQAVMENQLKSNDELVSKNLCSVRELDMVPVGFDGPLEVLKRNLFNDSVNTLLVTAPPGCGKTTLATQIFHDEEVKGKFKHIFFNVVSSTPDFRKLVQDLLQHSGQSPPTFGSDPQATVVLKKLLEKLRESGPILLVLDDVWHGADTLLKNFQNNIPGYKILVTSRSDLPGFNFTYQLKPLEDNHAKTLLVKSALRPDGASQADYDDLLQKILKRCSGFPIVIEVVGSSLKGQPLHVWKGQVESWSLGETILDNPHDRVLECLQHSFSFLKPPHLKKCFLDMGSFIEDQKIRASVIIDIWVELDGKGYSSSSTVYMKYLNDLASRNLLKLSPLGRKEPEDGFYNDFLVTQHDVLRELAIHQSKLEPNLDRKRLLSISTDDLFSVEMDVEALILDISSSNYALPEFISTMKKLKVVIIINHQFYPARLTNFSCLTSLPKLKRIRLENVSITFQDILQLKLSNLKKFSLFMCSFGEVSHDTKEIVDVSIALPSLEEIDIDYCSDLVELPFWISEVVSLKTLSITNCNKISILPEAIGNLSKLETLRLISCTNLSELPETTAELNNLRFLDISGCFQLEKLPLEIGNLKKNLKKISMRNCYRCNLPNSVKNLEDLKVICDEGTTFLWERFKTKMKNLTITEEETEHNLNSLQQ